MDKRGNRTQALEALANPATTTDTTIAYNDKGLVLAGTWSDVSGFKESSQFAASLKLMFMGENRKDGMGVLGSNLVLTMGTGPDHSLYDIYIGGSLWQSFDGYAASAGQVDIKLEVQGDGPHLLDIRSRAEKNKNATGYKVRFKQLLIADRTYTLHTIEYGYDALSRLLEARCNPNINTNAADADLLRRYLYAYDRGGNRTQQIVTVAGTPTTTNYTYNAANQLTSGGATYDSNGNLTNDGVYTYGWDRANRLIQEDDPANPFVHYTNTYDGLGNRVKSFRIPETTTYLLDLQPGLAVVLSETEDSWTTRYVHGPRGIHAQQDAGGNWSWMAQDGLGSVRGVVDNSVGVQESRNYDPIGNPFGVTGTSQTSFGFTGEQTDTNGQVYLRARYYDPSIGVFSGLDPFKGLRDRPMSLNGYSWVEGNVPNGTDPSGMIYELPQMYANCMAGFIQIATSTATPTPTPTATPTPSGCALINGPMSVGLSADQARAQVANLIAAIGFQQNRHLGSDAMVTTMVAALNVIDGGGSTVAGLEKAQSVYSYTVSYCNEKDLIARVNRCANGKTLSTDNCSFTKDEVLRLYGCVNSFMEKNINGQGEKSPPNAKELASTALTQGTALVEQRCGISTPSFSGTVATQIAHIDATDDNKLVYSFDASWLVDIDNYKRCYKAKSGATFDPVIIPPPAITPGSRAVMITDILNPFCGNWQCDRSTQTIPDYANNCCSGSLCPTPTPSK